jgi:pimeloyl-ACP methyl ester carboxylesterase
MKNMDLFYREYGKGEPLILLHGLYGCSDNWIPFAKHWANRGRRVIVPDLRNQGNSPHSSQHSFDLMADDLKLLLDKLEIRTSDFLGHSMGGNLSIKMALKFPSIVKKVVVVDVLPKSYSIHKSEQFDEHFEIMSSLNQVDLNKFKTFEEIDTFFAKFIHKKSFRRFVIKNIRKYEEGFQWRANIVDFQVMIDSVKDFEKIKQPLENQFLFLKGEKSDFILDEDYPFIINTFPNSKIVVIKNAKHWVQAQQPIEFMKEVDNFIL